MLSPNTPTPHQPGQQPAAQGRRALTAGPGPVFAVAASVGAILLVAGAPAAQCTNNTFASGLAPASFLALLLGLLLLPLFFCILSVYVSVKVAPRDHSENQPSTTRKWSRTPLLAIGVGGALAIGSYVNLIASYYCLTPAEIFIRPGILHQRKGLAWDDVDSVSAWCWTSATRGRPSYFAASLKFLFNDGEQLRISLVNGDGQVLMQNYVSIRRALDGKNYAYHAEATISPDSCPTGLYPVLRFWRPS